MIFLCNLDLIRFNRLDYSLGSELEDYILSISSYFTIKQNYFRNFCQMINASKHWSINTLSDDLDQWSFRFTKMFSHSYKIVELVKEAFSLCQNDEDINIFRGALAEALIIGKYGGKEVFQSNKSNCGWGAEISLNSIPIIYQCVKKLYQDCSDRRTVDFGIWDGFHCKLYECKIQPKWIGCKEVHYLSTVYDTFKTNNVSFEIFIFCLESTDSIEVRLIEWNMDPMKYKPVGHDNYYNH